MSTNGNFRIWLWSRFGERLCELETNMLVTYARTGITTAELILATRYDAKAAPEYINFANFITFEHARLPSFIGIIAPNDGLSWNGNGEMHIRLKDPTLQFTRRRAPLINPALFLLDTVGQAGVVFRELIGYANMQEDTRIRAGVAYDGDVNVHIQLRARMLIDCIDDLRGSKRWWSGFDISYRIGSDEQGKLAILADLLERKSNDQGYMLIEGINLETPDGEFYRLDGEMVNDMYVRNNGAEDGGFLEDWSVVNESIAQYGLWQNSEVISTAVFSQLTQQATLRTQDNAFPRKSFTLVAIETPESPDTFLHLRLGTVVRVILHSVGFYNGATGIDAKVIIDAMEYDTAENKLILTVMEY